MNLSITGGTAYQRSLCRRFANSVALQLCGHRLANVLTLTVTLDHTLFDDAGILGTTAELDDNRREFEVDIDAGLTYRYLLITLAHELVHVQQLAKHNLKYLLTGEVVWHKKKYTNSTSQRVTRLPWEIEATGLEETLFIEWIDEMKITDEWTHVNMFV